MTAIAISVDDAGASGALTRLAAVGRGNPKVMRTVALAMQQAVYNAFRFQQAPDGSPWPPLAPLTLRARARKGNHSQQPLIATGAMYRSITSDSSATEASIAIGAGLPDARAWWNQFGTTRAPARPLLPVTEFAAAPTAAWLDTLMAPIDQALREAVTP